MEDKIYVLSDGRVKKVPAAQDEAFQAELKEKGLTAMIQSDVSGNQISSTEDATAEQKTTASTQETNQSQINQQQDTEYNLEDGSLESQIVNSKNKLDSLDNAISSFNYEAKFEQIEKDIEKINNTDYASNEEVEDANKRIEELSELYQNMYIDYKNVHNEYETSRDDYNKLIGQNKKGKKQKPKNKLAKGILTAAFGPTAGILANKVAQNKALNTGRGAVSMVDNFIKGYETGELPVLDELIEEAIPSKIPIYGLIKKGSKALREKGVDVPENIGLLSLETEKERREKYESFMLDFRKKGIPLEIAKKLDPTNRVKFEGVLEWFDKHTYKHTDENGDPLDYLELFGKGEVVKGTDAFLDDVFGAIPSLMVSRIPIAGPAFMGAGMYMDNFEREIYERGIDEETTRNQIVLDSIISGAADFVTEMFGGRFLNKILRSGIPKKQATELLKNAPKAFFKKIGLAAGSEFVTEGAAGFMDLAADQISYGDQVGIKEYTRAFIKDGFIGMFLAGGTAASSRTTKESVYEFFGNAKYKDKQINIEKKIIDLTRGLDKAEGKSKDIIQKEIDKLKAEKAKNKKDNFDFFENLTQKEKEQYANNVDIQNEQLDLLLDQRNTKEIRDEAAKKYKEAIDANSNFYDASDLDYDSSMEQTIGKALKASEVIQKQKGFFGFNKDNLDIEFVESDKRLKELTEKFPGFNEADGMFYAQEKGKNKIYINSKVAAVTGQTNVLGHEYLHAIVSHAFSEGIGANNLKSSAASFRDYLIKTDNKLLVSRIERRLARLYGGRDANGNIIRDEHGLIKTEKLKDVEEYFNIFSDIISKEKITAVEDKSGGIKNSFRGLKRGLGFGEVDFQSGQEVFDFLVDYNTNMRRGSLLGKLTSKGVAKVSLKGLEAQIDEKGESDVIKDDGTKYSKSAKKPVDDLGSRTNWNKETWKKEGADKAIKEIKDKGLVDGLIAAKYKVRPVPENFVNDVLNSTFFVNHVRSFNPEVNDSLFGWINSQIRNKAGSVFNQNEKGKMPKSVKAVELDAVTTEGRARTEVADVDTSMETFTDNINYFQEEVQPNNTESRVEQSKLRQEIGIKNLGKSEIFKKVRTALSTSKAVDEKGFIKDFEKNLSNLLEPTIARILNDPAKIKKFRKGILEAIPIKTLVQMQKFLPEKIFVKDHGRQTNLTNLSKFVEKGLLPADILNNTPESKKRRAAGVRVYERLSTTTKQFENYVDAPVVDPKTGKRSGTRGNNRAKVISEVSKAIGKDATPETLTPEFVEDYLNIKDLKGKITPEKVIENISEEIDRSANLKFSKSAIIYKKHANLNTKQLMTELKKQGVDVKVLEVITKLEEYFGGKNKNVLKKRKLVDFVKSSKLARQIREDLGGFLSQHPQYISYFQASMASGYGNSLFGVKDVFYKITGLTPAKVEKLLSRYEYAKGKKLDSDKVKFIDGELKFKKGRKWISQKEFLKDNDARWDFIEDMFTDIRNYIQAKPSSASVFALFAQEGANTQNHVVKIMSPLVAVPMKNGRVMYIPIREEHGYPQNDISTILLAEAILPDGNIKNAMKVIRASYSQWALDLSHDSQIDAMGYGSKMPDFFYDIIVPRIIKGDLDYLPSGILGPVIRYIESNIDLNNYHLISENKTVTEYFGVNVEGLTEAQMQHVIPVQNEAIKRILSGEITKKEAREQVLATSKVMYSKSPLDIKKINNTIDAFNRQAELIKKQNKEIQADLEKRGYKFSKTGDVQGQTPAQMIKIIQADLEAKGYTFVDMDKKGMSTFDFDETLIIDGENFVVATNPLTGQEIEISSAEWPTRGPELTEAGYEMNFDDFVNVRGGVDGPLLQKMKNQIKKYGAENVFVLTARPQSADIAIHEWLKSKGVNIPFKNITGLADSRGQAKADWMLEKFSEGYNDMYFVDDALQNVEAVKEVLDQLDIKSKVVQAKIKFSLTGGLEFNKILEQSKGVAAKRTFSAQEARAMGVKKGRLRFFVPPSAEDFKGLVYSFLGKGREGDAHAAFFKENLFDPFSKGIRQWNTYKQAMSNDYQAVKKQFKSVGKILNKKVKGTIFTNDNAVRVYLWNKAGFEIPGITEKQIDKLVKHVEDNADLKGFAESLSVLSRVPEGYVKPEGYWITQSIASDLANTVLKVGRAQFLSEWIENKNTIFNEQNLNKIEAIYGDGFRDALENMLHRMETGKNRMTGKNKQVNMFMDWINGSVAATMFFNIRSAALQTISTVNFINMSDNNVFKAAAAFANQPQFWKDFSMIFNSPMLKQRRAGLQIDVSASEITRAYNQGKSKPEAVLSYLLEIGFTPTQVADSFAISMGGAPFYRNRVKRYIKEGMSQKEAENQAFLDFQEIAEETQQSSRPDLISAQQAGVLGRIILAWQNTPMQMTRLMKKALSDLVNRRRTAGYSQFQSDAGNISAIMYYGVVQNLIFGAMQTGLMFLLFGWDDDEERKKKLELRTANGALDTILRGTGIYGAGVSTLKNVLLKWREERTNPSWKRDDLNIAMEAISLSPPIGSKMRKIMSAIRTEKYNKGVSKEIGFRIENPNLSIAANWTEALLNIPVARVINKANNIEEALDSNNSIWQRVALVSGWSRWSVGVEDAELEAAKDKAKETRKKEKQKEKEKTNQQKKKGRVRCTATKTSGGRCKNTTTNKNKKCYAHQ